VKHSGFEAHALQVKLLQSEIFEGLESTARVTEHATGGVGGGRRKAPSYPIQQHGGGPPAPGVVNWVPLSVMTVDL